MVPTWSLGKHLKLRVLTPILHKQGSEISSCVIGFPQVQSSPDNLTLAWNSTLDIRASAYQSKCISEQVNIIRSWSLLVHLHSFYGSQKWRYAGFSHISSQFAMVKQMASPLCTKIFSHAAFPGFSTICNYFLHFHRKWKGFSTPSRFTIISKIQCSFQNAKSSLIP